MLAGFEQPVLSGLDQLVLAGFDQPLLAGLGAACAGRHWSSPAGRPGDSIGAAPITDVNFQTRFWLLKYFILYIKSIVIITMLSSSVLFLYWCIG